MAGRSVGRMLALAWLPLLLVATSTRGAALPGPPIFEAISHFPPFCYLPPESGLCPEKRTTNASALEDNRLSQSPPGGEDYDGPSGLNGPLLTRFYFDTITAQCYPFGAQNCGGNENRFETQAECLAKCRSSR